MKGRLTPPGSATADGRSFWESERVVRRSAGWLAHPVNGLFLLECLSWVKCSIGVCVEICHKKQKVRSSTLLKVGVFHLLWSCRSLFLCSLSLCFFYPSNPFIVCRTLFRSSMLCKFCVSMNPSCCFTPSDYDMKPQPHRQSAHTSRPASPTKHLPSLHHSSPHP